MENFGVREALWVFFLGALCGVTGETLLFLRQQCRQVESSLSEDFRVLAFLDSDLNPSKAQVLEEEVRTLPGVGEVRYLSRDAALSFLKERDPQMIKSVSVLGENPLNSVLEIRLDSDELPQFTQWLDMASKIPELSDLRFKPLQVQGILQIRFYRRFLDLAMNLAAVPWFLGAALGFWSAFKSFTASTLRVLRSRFALAGAGTVVGMGAVYVAATPMSSVPLWLWPSLWTQGALVLAGLIGAGFWMQRSMASGSSTHKHAHSEMVRFETSV